MSVPLRPLGVARQFINPEGKITWACHLKTQAWHAKLKGATLKWACHLSIKAWHASTSFQRRG
ncbi:hypothetical protein AHAS_Ahas11G0141800 [Arachis hypogaea]